MAVRHQPVGQVLHDQQVLGRVAHPGAGPLQARQQAAAAQDVVADHVLALVELVVEQPQRLRPRFGLALTPLKAVHQLFDAVQLGDRVLHALQQVLQARTQVLGAEHVRIQRVLLLERGADAAQRVGEALQLRDFVLGQVVQGAQQRPQRGRDDHPALVQAHRLVLNPARREHLVKQFRGAGAQILQAAAFVIRQRDLGVLRQHLAQDRQRLRLRQPPGFARLAHQPVRRVDVNRRRRPHQRPEKLHRHAGKQTLAEVDRRGGRHGRETATLTRRRATARLCGELLPGPCPSGIPFRAMDDPAGAARVGKRGSGGGVGRFLALSLIPSES